MAPIFKKGDKIYLLYRNIKTKRPNNKFDFKKIKLFKIFEKINTNNYRFELPKGI